MGKPQLGYLLSSSHYSSEAPTILEYRLPIPSQTQPKLLALPTKPCMICLLTTSWIFLGHSVSICGLPLPLKMLSPFLLLRLATCLTSFWQHPSSISSHIHTTSLLLPFQSLSFGYPYHHLEVAWLSIYLHFCCPIFPSKSKGWAVSCLLGAESVMSVNTRQVTVVWMNG